MLHRRILLAAPAVAAVAGPAWSQARRRGGRHAPPAFTGTPASTPLGSYDTAAKFAFVMDFNTGAVLLDKEGGTPMPPSSMTKLMTAYIVYGKLKAGELRLEQRLPVSQKAANWGGSRMFIAVTETPTVEELIRGMIVQSGNDACIALAEGIAGSEAGFVDLMNAKAKELGLQTATFRNCTGWPDPSQRMSCRDIAALARRLITDYPEYYHYDSEKSFKYNNISQDNRNPLVQRVLADGLKTGHTDEGGFGLVASAVRAGRRVILVVNGLTSMHARAEESERLLEWSYREFENVTLFNAGDAVENAKVWLGAAATVPLVGGRDLVITMPRDWRRTARIAIEYPSPVAAPISRGDVLGRLVVSGQGVPAMEAPLLAGADVGRLGLPGRGLAVVSRMVTGS